MSETLDIEPLASPPLSEPWVPLWPLAPARLGELAYAEFTANVASSATTEAAAATVVSAGALALDGSPIIIDFYAPAVVPPGVVGATVRIDLWDDGTVLGRIGDMQAAVAGAPTVSAHLSRRLTPTPGSHTYIVKMYVNGGTGTIAAGVGGSQAYVPGFIRISLAAPLLSAPPGAAVAVQYGTSLPTNPLDGQEAILVDSLTNPSYQWRFRYNAGSTSAYKWEFVGGSDACLMASTGALAALTAAPATWEDSATPGPIFVVPRAGDYEAIGAAQYSSTAAPLVQLSVWLGTTTNVGAGTAGYVDAGTHTTLTNSARINGMSVGGDVRMRFWSDIAGTVCGNRWMNVRPIRVS